MTQLSAEPVSTYYGYACPECGRIPEAASEPRRCECGYSYQRTYVVPYDFAWSFDEPFRTQLYAHRALRLLGKCVDKDVDRLRDLKHVEYLALSRYPKFDLGMLQGFRVLRSLDLDFLQVKTLDGIERLEVTALALTELRTLENIDALRGQPLVVLRVALCGRIKDHDPIGDLERLARCDIEARSLASVAFLRRIKALRRLGLAVDKVESDVLADLSALSGLEWLGVRKRLIGRAGLPRLREALPNCAIELW